MTKITIILLGESGVGKTTLLLRLKTGKFRENSVRPTVSPEFEVKRISVENNDVNLFIWDTAGQERYRTVTRSYYRQADGVLLVYDVTNLETFYKLSSWLSELREHNNEAEILIAGNKNEDSSKKTVVASAVKSFAKEEGLEYMEMSAKSGKNVEQAFERLAKKVLIAKGILSDEGTNKCDNSAKNETCGKTKPKNVVEGKDNDVIRLDEVSTVTSSQKKRSCC